LLCQGICEVHLEAGQLTAFILEVEGRVGALQANLDCAVGLDLIQEIGRKHGHEQARAEQQPKATEQEMATQDGESHVRSPDGSGSHKALTADIYSIGRWNPYLRNHAFCIECPWMIGEQCRGTTGVQE